MYCSVEHTHAANGSLTGVQNDIYVLHFIESRRIASWNSWIPITRKTGERRQ